MPNWAARPGPDPRRIKCEGNKSSHQNDAVARNSRCSTPCYCLSAAWGDYNNDGFPDLYIAIGGDTSHVNALYRNKGDGTLTRETVQAGPITSDSHDSAGCTWIDSTTTGISTCS